MTRIRQQNVTAARWSSNGESLGAIDLTLPENEAFGANVFSDRRPARTPARRRLREAAERPRAGEAIDPRSPTR